MALSIIILAAGHGVRMHSELPKVLHTLGGKPLLQHVVKTASQFPLSMLYVIVGYQGDIIRQSLPHLNATWVEQSQRLGTAHAVAQALPFIPSDDQVLILYGDVPLISCFSLEQLIQHTPRDGIGIITAVVDNPSGLGRIIRDNHQQIQQIVEDKDATETERACKEINSGIYLIPAHYLKRWLPLITNQNQQQEYYLTDIIRLAVQEKIPISSYSPYHYHEISGVNNRLQLSELERFYQRRQAEKFMHAGLSLLDPNRFDLRGELTIGKDVIIDINVIIEGHVSIGNHCIIGAHSLLKNVKIGDHVIIKPYSMIEDAIIENHCTIGPFARLRTGCELASYAEIGNFIEIKNSIIGEATKIHHVGYIGDSELGKHVNIGAGTITCNYDGIKKHKTTIGDHAFIGSNTELVAPVTIGEYATIGAGSTITRHAPAHQLTLARSTQKTIESWRKKKKTTER